MRYRYVMALFIMLFLSGCSQKTTNLPTVQSVDLDRYQGVWYEIARYENSFEKGCIGASAKYKLEDKEVQVINTCYDANFKEIGKAEGSAYSTNEQNTKLKVTFFWPFYGDYWVIKLADDYRYTVVSEPRKKYLWILAREKELNNKDKEEILSFLNSNGFETEKLFWTKLKQ